MRLIPKLCLLAALCSPIPAAATLVTYEFEGLISELIGGGGNGLFGSPVAVGDNFSGRFSYETGAGNPDQFISGVGSADIGFYNLTSFELDGTLLSITGGSITIFNDPFPAIFPNTPQDDEFRISVGIAPTNPNPYPAGVLLTLRAPFTLFGDDSLPELLDLADFSSGASLVGIQTIGIDPAPSIVDAGQLSSLTLVPSQIPLPPGLPLLGAGLLAAGMLRLRR